MEEKKIQCFHGNFLSRSMLTVAEGYGGEISGCPLLMIIYNYKQYLEVCWTFWTRLDGNFPFSAPINILCREMEAGRQEILPNMFLITFLFALNYGLHLVQPQIHLCVQAALRNLNTGVASKWSFCRTKVFLKK